jgi:hypothetical protein
MAERAFCFGAGKVSAVHAIENFVLLRTANEA